MKLSPIETGSALSGVFGAVTCGSVAAFGLTGCTAVSASSAPEPAAEPASVPSGTGVPSQPTPVTITGQVLDTTGAGIDGVEVLRVPADVYLVPLLRAQTDTLGDFTLGGVEGDSRQWVYFGRTGFVGMFQALETTRSAREALSAVTLLSEAEAAAMAQTLGATLDPKKIVLVIPVTVNVEGQPRPALPSDVQITFQPSPDVPVHYADGGAIALNALAYSTYQVTVARNGRVCPPASHPNLVAADGSVEVRPMSGTWTVGPTMACQ